VNNFADRIVRRINLMSLYYSRNDWSFSLQTLNQLKWNWTKRPDSFPSNFRLIVTRS